MFTPYTEAAVNQSMQPFFTLLACLALGIGYSLCSEAGTITEVAITVDDIPEPTYRGTDVQAIADTMLKAFRKHHLKGVYGMLNGIHVQEIPGSRQVLEQWIRDGQLLGNHTWSHPDLVTTTLTDYLANIRQNEALLQALMPFRNYRYFRFPYLAEGDTENKRQGVRQFLADNGYRTAEVTVDFFDYEWIEPYDRCLASHRTADVQWLRKSFLENARYGLEIAQRLANLEVQRHVKHILLLHFARVEADMMDALLSAYEARGVRFIGLPEALSDPIYQTDTQMVLPRSYTFLNQIRLRKHLDNPTRVAELYAKLPEDKLASLCQ